MDYRRLVRYLDDYYSFLAEGPLLSLEITDTMLNIWQYRDIELGNKRPTIVVPGFSVGNRSTLFLRQILNYRNHNTFPWIDHRNTGFTQGAIERTIDQVKEVTDTFGQSVNLVGQSLGGCYIRAVANILPDHVNSVVTMGSPINSIQRVHPDSIEKYNTITGLVDAAFIHHGTHFETFYPNPPCATTSMYSRIDGVVHWSQSIISESDLSENIEIRSGHMGMGFSLEVIRIVANRLAQEKDSWIRWTEILSDRDTQKTVK